MKKKRLRKEGEKKKKVKKTIIKKKLQKKSKRIKKPEMIKIKKSSKKLEKIKKATKTTKPEQIKRVKTGIPGLDKLIEGGFEHKSINLVVGGSGSGKTIFAVQFLIEGIKNNENVLYITFEESKEEFYRNMLDFGWDLNKLEKAGKFIFLEYSPQKIKMMLDEGGGAIESIVLKQKIKRMAIDTISSFYLLFEEESLRRQAILSLFDILQKWDCTTLLTLQKDPAESKEGDISSIEFQVDSVILLYFIKVKNKRQRFIEVLKMRGTEHSKETLVFEIDKGINIKKKAKINV